MKITRFALAAVLATAMTLTAHAHSFVILLSNNHIEEPGSKAIVYIGWGHALPVSEFIDAKEFASYEVQTPDGSTAPLRAEGRSLQAHEITLDQPGIYQFSAVRKPTILSSVKGTDGKVKMQRVPKTEVKLGEGQSLVTSMRSQMFAKAIATSGAVAGKAAARLGHTIEIVPVSKLDALSADQPATFQVFFEGKPLANAKVTAASLSSSVAGAPGTANETDSQGNVELTPASPGPWIIEVSHKVPSTGDTQKLYDVESYYASLVVDVK
jgi:uncharacterized GH25 family protein